MANNKKPTAEEILKKRNKYTDDYKREHYDRFNVLTPKGKKALYSEYAKAHGISMNKLVMQAVDAWIESHSDDTYTIK